MIFSSDQRQASSISIWLIPRESIEESPQYIFPEAASCLEGFVTLKPHTHTHNILIEATIPVFSVVLSAVSGNCDADDDDDANKNHVRS